MTKSKTTRALLAATCVAGSACVSGPQHREPPKPAECPPGSDETLRRFNLMAGRLEPIIIPPFKANSPEALVSEGPVTGEVLPPWGDLPGHTRIYGELFFAKGHVYGRFTQARLPDGGFIPVCLELVTSHEKLGTAMEPGSTSEKARVPSMMFIRPVFRFH